MGQIPRAKHFYGIRVDEGSYPDEVDELLENHGRETALSLYLLHEAGYAITDDETYRADTLLPEYTGVSVIDLDGDGVFLAVDSTVTESNGWNGAQRIEQAQYSLEQHLSVEVYAKRLGAEPVFGWYLWSDFK